MQRFGSIRRRQRLSPPWRRGPTERQRQGYRGLQRSHPARSGNLTAYQSRAGIWLERAEYDKVIADSTEAIRLDPGCARNSISRGIAWGEKKDAEKAIADLDEAIRLDPTFAVAYACRGAARVLKKEHDKAIADFDKAIQLDPTAARAYAGRGKA